MLGSGGGWIIEMLHRAEFKPIIFLTSATLKEQGGLINCERVHHFTPPPLLLLPPKVGGLDQ